MIIYRKPTVSSLILDTISPKLQGTGTLALSCDGSVECDGTQPLLAGCNFSGDIPFAFFFLPESDLSDPAPTCSITVNGVASDCTVTPDGETDCAEGARWIASCDANAQCTTDNSETFILSCDGFEQGTCSNSEPS